MKYWLSLFIIIVFINWYYRLGKKLKWWGKEYKGAKMLPYKDTQTFMCVICGHTWHLLADKIITNKQFYEWFNEVYSEHNSICKGKK